MTISSALLRASACLAVSAILLALLMWVLRLRSSRLRRGGWLLVLLQGAMLAPWSLAIPWYEPSASSPRAEDWPAALPGDLEGDGAVGDWAALGPAGDASGDPSGRSWAAVAMFVWGSGAVLLLGAWGGAYLLLLRESFRAEPAGDLWQRELDSTLRQCRIRKRLPLRVHASLGPLLCRLPGGCCVIVPGEKWAQLSREERCAVLRHEALHWRRGDVWKSLAARLLVVPHWFNPAAWWAVRKFEETAEWACDEQLAREAPRQAPVLARALLHFTASTETSPLAAAATGAPLCTRLRRLLQPPENRDSVMKKGTMLTVLAALAVAGAIRVKLVAKDDDPAAATAVAGDSDADFARRVSLLQAQLPAEGPLGQLRTALGSEEGRLVMRGRADRYTHEAQAAARAEALPQFLGKYFERSGDGYTLRDGQQAFREQMLKTVGEFNTDIEKVSTALKQMADKMEGDSEATQLLTRFMREDAGAVMLYVHRLRSSIRPSLEMVEYQLRKLVVRNDQGEYVVREGSREAAERLVTRAEAVLSLQKTITRELTDWTEDVAQVDDLHRNIVRAFRDPVFAVVVSHKAMDGDKELNREQLVNKLLDGIDDATKEAATGLVLRDEARGEVVELLKKYDAIKRALSTVKPLLQEFSESVSDKDELHQRWAVAIKSDLIAVKLGEEIGGRGPVSVVDAVRDLLGEAVTPTDDGGYRLAEGREEEINEQIQNAFREYRKLSRRLRPVDRISEQILDQDLAAAIGSIGGKFTIATAVENAVKSQRVDGLARWSADFLEKADDGGFRLTEAGREEVASMLREVEAVRKELKNDDF